MVAMRVSSEAAKMVASKESWKAFEMVHLWAAVTAKKTASTVVAM